MGLYKKALRIITHSPPRAHSQPLFKQLNIFNIYDIYKYQMSCFVFLHIKINSYQVPYHHSLILILITINMQPGVVPIYTSIIKNIPTPSVVKVL